MAVAAKSGVYIDAFEINNIPGFGHDVTLKRQSCSLNANPHATQLNPPCAALLKASRINFHRIDAAFGTRHLGLYRQHTAEILQRSEAQRVGTSTLFDGQLVLKEQFSACSSRLLTTFSERLPKHIYCMLLSQYHMDIRVFPRFAAKCLNCNFTPSLE